MTPKRMLADPLPGTDQPKGTTMQQAPYTPSGSTPSGSTLLPGSPEWLRTPTASKAAPMLGVSPYCGAAKQWHIMRGDIAPDPITDAMRRGTIFEAAILDWFFQVMHPDWERAGQETTYRRDDMPWAAVNLDDVATVHDADGAITYGVEAKDTRSDEHWGEALTDQIPVHYLVQVMFQMHISGHRRTYVIRHGPFVDQFAEYIVDYDPELGDGIAAKVYAFYLSLDDDNAEPALDGLDSTFQAMRKVHPEIDRDEDWDIGAELAIEYTTARIALDTASERHNLAKSTVLKHMGRSRRAICNGQTIAQRQATRGGVTLVKPRKPIDLDALTEGH